MTLNCRLLPLSQARLHPRNILILPIVRGVEALVLRQNASSRNEIHLDPNPVGIFAQDVIVTGRPGPVLGRADDVRVHVFEQSRNLIDIVGRTFRSVDKIALPARSFVLKIRRRSRNKLFRRARPMRQRLRSSITPVAKRTLHCGLR